MKVIIYNGTSLVEEEMPLDDVYSLLYLDKSIKKIIICIENSNSERIILRRFETDNGVLIKVCDIRSEINRVKAHRWFPTDFYGKVNLYKFNLEEW